MLQHKIILGLIFLIISGSTIAQDNDSTVIRRFSFHGQVTTITQFKPAFKAKYTGPNSLIPEQETQTSLTATLFAGMKLWRGASLVINPEISGGSGLSNTLGVADATNGETFRVGSHNPRLYLARIYFQQIFAIDKSPVYQEDDENQLPGYLPKNYVEVTAGKISLTDFFDDNIYSHDPRTQFLSWGLMDNGAWDYAADTRGYTPGIVLEYVSPLQEFCYAISLEPLVANGNNMNWDIGEASAHTFEYSRHYQLRSKPGTIRLLTYLNIANMGNYNESIALNPSQPDIIATRSPGRTKYGFGISADQAISKNTGIFFRAGWNDGNNETWAFTEIDRTVSGGISFTGTKWNRPHDNIGMAFVTSGISLPHRNYLKAGGDGFILGDGNLNYGWEYLTEAYYSLALIKNYFFVTGTYQFLVNPGYNKDRGPVNIFSLRLHLAI
jgi:high affinity Mn2+ porin